MRAVITDLAINGISIYEAENEQFLTKALNYTREISLPHDKNSLNIHFSNFDYPHIQNAMYQYYLEGIDNTWRPMTSINLGEAITKREIETQSVLLDMDIGEALRQLTR